MERPSYYKKILSSQYMPLLSERSTSIWFTAVPRHFTWIVFFSTKIFKASSPFQKEIRVSPSSLPMIYSLYFIAI